MRTLQHFSEFISKINQSNSRNYKMEILREYSNDDVIKYFLDFIFNPYIITGISDKKLNKWAIADIDAEIIDIREFLEYLKSHNTGTDQDVKKCLSIMHAAANVNENLVPLLHSIITKNLQLGVDVLSINKCMNNFIPTFSVQLANKYFEKPEVVVGKEFALTTKIDGSRIIALKENGQVHFYTRAGQPYENLIDLEAEMLDHMPDNICLDGEITLLDKGNLTSKDQYKQTMKITRRDGEKHGVKMLVFDCMTADEFRNSFCDTKYTDRRNKLTEIFSNGYTFIYFNLLPILYQGTDTEKISDWLNYNVDHGEEGVMVNLCDAPYSFKRTDNLLKVKKMKDIDLEIIDYEGGSNSNAGKLGAFIVDYNGNRVKVGSGFSKELREEIWKHPNDYLGLTITIQYFEETENQNGGKSLRFPVFRDFRFDK